MPLLSAFARAFGTVLVAVPVAAAVPAVANPPVPAVAPAAAPTDEDNTVPIISSVRIRPAEPVLGGKAPTKVTVDVRVGTRAGSTRSRRGCTRTTGSTAANSSRSSRCPA